jgi:hypothetical protein
VFVGELVELFGVVWMFTFLISSDSGGGCGREFGKSVLAMWVRRSAGRSGSEVEDREAAAVVVAVVAAEEDGQCEGGGGGIRMIRRMGGS